MYPALAILMLLGDAPKPDSTIQVQAGKVVNKVSPLMYGSCIEDVNHEIYGGLYVQRIFGESFEEPPAGPGLPGWKSYGGEWSLKDGELSVKANQGAKAVRESPMVAGGSVSCEVRFADAKGYNAGLIVRVQDPRVGADTWAGYEVSLSARNRNVMLGRHNDDFHRIKEAPAEVEPRRWHRLRVEREASTLRIFVDDAKKPAITFEDPESIRRGLVGVRTWESDASFRNLVIEPAGKEAVKEAFTPDPEIKAVAVSGAWDLIRTGDAVAKLPWDADRPFNGDRSQRIEMAGGKGTVGVANRGLNRWRIAVRERRTYEGRCYLRSDGKFKSATRAS